MAASGVVDFGIARALTTARVTATGLVLGSVPYLSPEADAWRGGDRVERPVLAGRRPRTSCSRVACPGRATRRPRLRSRGSRSTAPPPSTIVADLPPGLDAIVARALAADPADRYPSARAFADALEVWRRRWTSCPRRWRASDHRPPRSQAGSDSPAGVDDFRGVGRGASERSLERGRSPGGGRGGRRGRRARRAGGADGQWHGSRGRSRVPTRATGPWRPRPDVTPLADPSQRGSSRERLPRHGRGRWRARRHRCSASRRTARRRAVPAFVAFAGLVVLPVGSDRLLAARQRRCRRRCPGRDGDPGRRDRSRLAEPVAPGHRVPHPHGIAIADRDAIAQPITERARDPEADAGRDASSYPAPDATPHGPTDGSARDSQLTGGCRPCLL